MCSEGARAAALFGILHGGKAAQGPEVKEEPIRSGSKTRRKKSVSKGKHPRHLKRASSDLAGELPQRSHKRRVPRKTPPEAARTVKERPTHFLSVRVQNTDIWRKVAAVQQDIIKDHEHLRDAAIPVQDLHVTLFVATLREEDGSLERARQTLEGCSDIIKELELAPGSTESCGDHLSPGLEGAGANSKAEQLDLTAFPSSRGSCVEGDVGETGDASQSLVGGDSSEVGLAVGEPAETPRSECTSIDKVDGLKQDPLIPSNRLPSKGSHGRAHAVDRGTPLTLSFEGLATFGKKVLYARLVEDGEANRFRRLTVALHERFVRASLVKHHDESSSKRDTSSSGAARDTFDFIPHLTVLKTSKLKRKWTVIPKESYCEHVGCSLGSHSPTAIELSCMLKREDSGVPEGWEPGEARPYYKCDGILALCAK